MNIILLTVLALVILVGIYLTFRKPQQPTDPALVKKELDLVYQLIKPHELEAVKIYPKNQPRKGRSNSGFGGTPYWPESVEYPKDHKGSPMILLAQLNFKEIPYIEGFPAKGILQFFIAQDSSLGLEYESKNRSLIDIVNSPKGYKVVFHEELVEDESKLMEQTTIEIKKSSLPFKGIYSLVFEKVIDRLSPTDYRFDKVVTNFSELDDTTSDALFDELDSSGCKIGGYATFTQDDPRGFSEIGEWILLFQMDSVSDEGVDIMWGDAGVANFFIQPDALKRKDFSHILYNWDCC